MYHSQMIKSAVVVILETAYAMENTKQPHTLFEKHDVLIQVINSVVLPNIADKKYVIDKQAGLERYKLLYNRPISVLQSLLITKPNEVPISRVLIVLAIQLQEKLVENNKVNREAIINNIAFQLMKRCKNLEQELMNMDVELTETGEIRVFTV